MCFMITMWFVKKLYLLSVNALKMILIANKKLVYLLNSLRELKNNLLNYYERANKLVNK